MAKFPFFLVFNFCAISDLSGFKILTLPLKESEDSDAPQLGHLSPES